MYLEEVTDEHGLKQDKWSLQRVRFGDEGQLEVIGWGTRDKSGSKNYVVVCHKCSQDSELFGDGLFRATKGNILKRKSMPCGCAKNPRWTKEQHAIFPVFSVAEIPTILKSDSAKISRTISTALWIIVQSTLHPPQPSLRQTLFKVKIKSL